MTDRKVNHWDTAIRDLTAKALHRLTVREPKYVSSEILPKLFQKTTSLDVNMRHGCVLAIGEIVLSLKNIEDSIKQPGIYITIDLVEMLSGLIDKFQKKDQFKGLSGEMMYQCSCDFIRNCSIANVPVTTNCIQTWQSVIDESIIKNSIPIRGAAIAAIREVAIAHYERDERMATNQDILQRYVQGAKEDLWEFARMGYVSAIGALPAFMLTPNLKQVMSTLIICALTPIDRKTLLNNDELADMIDSAAETNWSEARRDSVKALSNVLETLGFEQNEWLHIIGLDKVVNCFLIALQEYTIDNRGDIGAWVREAAMVALFKLIVACPNEHLKPEWIHAATNGFLQQAVEKIDRTRALAGKLFCRVVQWYVLFPLLFKNSN